MMTGRVEAFRLMMGACGLVGHANCVCLMVAVVTRVIALQDVYVPAADAGELPLRVFAYVPLPAW